MAPSILVTGGCGFIGRHLVATLLQRGHHVRVIDPAPWPEAVLPPRLDHRRASILDEPALAAAMHGVRQVFHLAGNPNLWARDASIFEAINHQGTLRVLAAAQRASVTRLVHCSTESILKSGRPRSATIDETAEIGIDDVPGPYCRSKLRAEIAAREAARQGLPVVIVNPTMPLGPGDLALTPPTRMLLGFLNGSTPAYLDCVFNLVDARDAALGHILAAETGRIGERYILGGENITLGDFLLRLQAQSGLAMTRRRVPYAVALLAASASEAVSALTGRPPLAPLSGVRLARSPLAFDSGKARRELGWQPRPLAETLSDAIADLARRGLLHRRPRGLADQGRAAHGALVDEAVSRID